MLQTVRPWSKFMPEIGKSNAAAAIDLHAAGGEDDPPRLPFGEGCHASTVNSNYITESLVEQVVHAAFVNEHGSSGVGDEASELLYVRSAGSNKVEVFDDHTDV